MPTAIQNKFDGGHAEDIRTTATDQCEKSLNFDIFTNPHKLLPYRDSVTETVNSGVLTDFQMNGVLLIGSTYYTVGYASSGSSTIKFFTKSNIVDNWQATNTNSSTLIQGSLTLYKGVAYCLGYNGSNQLVLVNSSGTTVGTATTANQPANANAFVHPEDNILYIVSGKIIWKWDGTTFTEYASILPSDFVCYSITEYGTYLAIGGTTGGRSVVYLWGRDGSLNTLQGQIPFGDGTIYLLENIGNYLVGIVISSGSLSSGSNGSIDVKVYSGGATETIKSINISTSNMGSYKTKYDSKLYFGFGGDDAIYVVGKNKDGRIVISKDRYFQNGTTILSGTPIPTILGGFLWTSFGSSGQTGKFYRTSGAPTESATYLNTSVYKTTINPGMPLTDRGKNKRLLAIRVYYTGKYNGNINVKYAVDTSTMTSVASESTTAIEDMKQATMQADGNAFNSGKEIQFQLESIRGVEIKGYEYDYEILNQ